MAKKVNKGIQVDPDIKKAYNKVVNTAAETLAGPAYQAAKGIYNYFNPQKAKKAVEVSKSKQVKKPSSPQKEKIYDLGVLKEHEVVYNKPEHKGGNKALGSLGAKRVSDWTNEKNVIENYNSYDVGDDSSEDAISEDVYKGYGGG
jgi:hypothetical protein